MYKKNQGGTYGTTIRSEPLNMNSKNRPSLLNTISFRSQTIEQVAKKISKAEESKFAFTYAPVPQIAAKILNGEISQRDLIKRFDENTGDKFEIHRLNIALALSRFGQTLGHQVSPLKPFYLEILRDKIWIKIAPLGYFTENGIVTLIDYNPRKSLSFSNDHAAFSAAITVPPYSTETPLFDYREHKYLMLDLSAEDDLGNRIVKPFHSDDVGIMRKEDVEEELQIIADAYKLVRSQPIPIIIPNNKTATPETPLFANAGIILDHGVE